MSKSLNINSNPAVTERLTTYPPKVQKKLQALRKLILETAKALDDVVEIEETLKWREPSYLVKKGSTFRMDWKPKAPEQYALYFKCTSKLVLTFREVYGDFFNYENNRAILFTMEDKLPKEDLGQCIAAALRYHKVKELPQLGISQ